MASCQNCQCKWKRREVLRVGFSKNGLACPYCGTKQYVSEETTNWLTLTYWSPIFLLMILLPSFVELSSEEKPYRW
ncbi:TIGR04104 family putative zinc finger protein [Bacillus sp. FJAT-42315]|uniref:TIGR04104 family putative zinc finger protein n=1 Tax=Bacillus sp. FJAT-42315 TaxID=2014077 RepID=UPI000C23CF67|nr:TIGR04104 family putative zinc finger protein [Bacillus sp. FJAT-42315]